MPDLNERLSNWNALHSCYCHRWQWCAARASYERPGEGKWKRLWAGDLRRCEVCGYDLTRPPMENLLALTAKDWTGTIKGACLYSETPWALPADTVCEFVSCNLDNVTVPAGCKIVGGCHRLIVVQNDLADWVCDWKTGLPVEPTDLKSRLREGLNVDPKLLPEKPLAEEEFAVVQEQQRDAKELAEAQATVATLTAKAVG